MEWYLKVLRNYVTFTGRARRREFWMFTLFSIIVQVVLYVLDVVIGTSDVLGDASDTPFAGTGLLSGIYSLAVLLPSLAVGARRLHDIGRSGWWQALTLLYLVPLFGSPVAGVIGVVLSFVAVVVLIVWFATDGEPGPNAHGPNPKTADVPPSS